MQRRTAIKLLAGAFIGQPLLGDGSEGFAPLVPFGKRHWLSVNETPWQSSPNYYFRFKRLVGLRSDGVHFHTITFTAPLHVEDSQGVDTEQGRMTMDTFLDPLCECRVEHRCSYHEEMMSPLNEGGPDAL